LTSNETEISFVVCEETQAVGEIIDANNCSSVTFILDLGATNYLVFTREFSSLYDKY